MARSPGKPHAQLAGFTLIELLAVLVIISSTSWLLIRAFDPSAHSAYSFSKVFNQYVMRAQSYALSQQSADSAVMLIIDSTHGAPNLTLKYQNDVLAQYRHEAELAVDLTFANSSSEQYAFAFDRQAMLINTESAGSNLEPPKTMSVAGGARYCFTVNGFLKPLGKGC